MTKTNRQIELELYLRVFTEKFIYDDCCIKYTIHDYFKLLSVLSSDVIEKPSAFITKETIIDHLDIINAFLHQRRNFLINPLLSLKQERNFSNAHTILYRNFFELINFNETDDQTELNHHSVSLLLFPLYVGLIASINNRPSSWSKIREKASYIASSIVETLATPSKHTKAMSIDHFGIFPIDTNIISRIYDYLLELYFPNTMITYLNALENFSTNTITKYFDHYNIEALKTFSPPCQLWTTIGINQYYTQALNAYWSFCNEKDQITLDTLKSLSDHQFTTEICEFPKSVPLDSIYKVEAFLTQICIELHQEECAHYQEIFKNRNNSISMQSLAFKISCRMKLTP